MSDLLWESIKLHRQKAARLLPPVHRLRLVADSRTVLSRHAPASGFSLIDIGANDRNLEKALKGLPGLCYFSCDIDQSLPHDYFSLDAIDRTFDIAVCFDIIEHLAPRDTLSLLSNIHRVLEPGGLIFVSTPNVDHPTRFWRDCTHITPFRYDELKVLRNP